MKKRSQKELRVYCRELDALFALSDEREIRDALFALVPNLRRVVDTLVQSLPISGSRLSWQPDSVRKGANGPTEEWELSCRADAATGDTIATVSALISFYNPYMGGGFRLDARIFGGQSGHAHMFWAEAYQTDDPHPSFRVRFAAPITASAVSAAFGSAFTSVERLAR